MIKVDRLSDCDFYSMVCEINTYSVSVYKNHRTLTIIDHFLGVEKTEFTSGRADKKARDILNQHYKKEKQFTNFKIKENEF